MSSPIDSVILTYHSIDASESVLSTSPSRFAEQMSQLADGPYQVIPLARIGTVPSALAITFDDGYCNFRTEALPVLARYGFPATVFAVPGECGGSNRWDQGDSRIPNLPLMDWRELDEISRSGVSVGAHTMTHANLTKIAPADAEWEIASSRQQLEERLQRPIEEFAYPYGACKPIVRSIVDRHFRTACGVELGFVSDGSIDRLLLPRVDAFYLRSNRAFREFSNGRLKGYLAVRRLLREIRSWAAH